MGMVVSLEELTQRRLHLRRQGRTLVLTNGHFDLLHVGHLQSLRQAKALGDVLAVAVNDDASTERLKGPGRPIVPAAERAELLAALEMVDYVTIFEGLTAEKVVVSLQPDVYAKGGDYGPEGKPLIEAALVASYGGKVALLPLASGHSTSQLIERAARAGQREQGAKP